MINLHGVCGVWIFKIMKNLSSKIWFLIAILLVFVLPFFLNWVLMLDCSFDFVGQDTDWLAFWGAYLGAVFTLLLGLYSIHRNNQKQICLMRHEAQIHALQIEIEKLNLQRVEFINYARKDLQLVDSLRVTNLIYALEKHLRTRDATLILLEQYQSECCERKNRYLLLNQIDSSISSYNVQFLVCIGAILEKLTQLGKILQEETNLKVFFEKINKVEYESEFTNQKTDLCKKASEIINDFTEKISNKRNELESLQSRNNTE